MQRLLGFVIDIFSELGPVKKLFKFLFGRLFNNLIDREIKLSDFKNNILELENLPLSAIKINKVYLSDSPYKLKEGKIGKLKIEIASFKDLASKDIEVQIDKIHLVFAFDTNYHKQKNFQMGQNNSQPEPEIQDIDLKDEDEEKEEFQNQNGQQKQGKQDMFKQFIRQVLSNIKLIVNDLVIDLYMSKDEIEKQPYVMLRLKKIKIYQQKKDDIQKKLKVQKERSENLYWIKLKEISAFIIKPCEKQKKLVEFPFSYPTINDEQCIFTTSFKMKQFRQAIQSQDKKEFDKLNQSYLFDFTTSMVEKDIRNQNVDDESFLPNHFQIETLFNPNEATVKSVKIYIPPVEIQLDPIQLKVLKNFSDQYSSYSKMRKINEYKRNNFSQIEIPLYGTENRQLKQNMSENKKQEEEDFEKLQQQKSVIVTNNCHFQIGKEDQNQNLKEENKHRDSSLRQDENIQNVNLNKKQNSSSQNEEYDLMNQIQFDFYNTQVDFKIFAINIYLLKKQIKVDENKRILPNKQDGDNEENDSYLYLRNWIYYYDEVNEKVLYPKDQITQQASRFSKGKNQQSIQSASQIYLDKTSFNDSIPCSYFLFQLKAFKIITQSPTKKVISVESIKLIDVNLINNSGIFSEIKQNVVNPSQISPQLDNSKMSIQQIFKVSQIQNIDQSQQGEMFQSALEQLAQIQMQKQQSYRDSLSQSIKKSIQDGSGQDDELFYSMSDNQQINNMLQSSIAYKMLEEIKEEVNKKQKLDFKPWQISKQNQHYCISYILLIKNQKKPNIQPKSSNLLASCNISRIQYKQDILFNSNWLSEENKKNQQLPLAFQLELIKRGSVIDGQASIGSMYTSFDLRILRDFYQIMFPCDDWGKFTEQYKAYDSKLQRTENITLLDQYAKQCEQIEKFTSLNALNQKKQMEGEVKQQEEKLQIEFSLNIQKFKFVYFSYQEKSDFKQTLKKYDLNNISSLICANNTTCFCSNLMKDARNNKKYLAENLAVQFNNINFTYHKSNQQNSNSYQLDVEKAVVGLLKINKDLCLESTEPIFKFNNLLDIESVKLNLILSNSQQVNQQGSSLLQNCLNLSIGSLQINVWNLDKILNLVEQSQSLFQDYQNLLQKLQKFDRELCRSSKVLTEKYSQNDEDKSEDGQGQEFDFNEGLALQYNSEFIYEQDQEVRNFLSQFYLQIHINKLDIRIIYLKNYKNCYENIKNSNLSGNNDYNKGNLLSYILKNQTEKKYTPFKYQLIPQNFCLQLIFRHNFVNIDRGQHFNLKIYEIYLVDHLQSKINLGNYKKNSNGEDLTYNQLIQISSDSKEIENKLLIYSTSYYDPRLIEQEQNSLINSLNIIDLDKNEKIQRNSQINDQNKKQYQSVLQGQDTRDQSKPQPVIYMKMSYKVEQQNTKVKSDPNPNLKIQNQNSNNLNESVVSEDGDQEMIKDNVKKTTKNKIIFSSIAIQDFIIRFGDFRSEIIQNFLDIANVFGNKAEIQPKENTLQNQANKVVQSQNIQNDKFPKQFQQIQHNETIMQVEIGNMFINNIAIDLFPFHDEDIRQKLPKVYQNVAEQNQKSGFFTNQRSILLLRNIIIKKFKYMQVDSNVEYAQQPAFVISQNIFYDTKKNQQNNLEFQLEVKGLDLYTLVFDDFKKYLNPIILCRQNFIFKDIQSLESRINLDNKQYDVVNQLEQLGFQNIVEIEGFLHLKQSQEIFSACLQIEKLYINACKDSIISFPLHITLISLLFQRFAEPLTKQQKIDLSNSQSMKDQSNNLNNSMKKSQKQQNLQENKNENQINSNNQPKQKNDLFDFEVFGEEFQIEEDKNTQFQNDAKDQDIEYFHKQNLDDQRLITQFDFSINKLEIQIFSGQDFSFETKQKAVTAVRKRLQTRDTKQNLLLTFYKLRVLYSQYSTIKKINLCIHGIELQGTVANQAQQIIQKKDNKQKMILLDVTINELNKLISLRTYLARIKLIVDKVHKQLFEDLSQVHIDLEQIAVNKSQIRPEHSEAILFNNISKISSQQNEQDQEILLQNEINLDNQKEDEDIDDEYEIYNGDQIEYGSEDSQQYKLSIIQICPIEIEITVNWFVNSILKDSLLIFNQYYNSKEKGIAFDEDLIFFLQNHYTKIFDVEIMKNSQILQIMKDVVLIRNITNITRNLANIFILPYQSFRKNGKIATGLIEGVRGFQQSIFTETKNLLSVVSNIYSQYIKYNIMKITKIKKLLKNKKQK